MRTRNQVLRVPLSKDQVSRAGGVQGADARVVGDDAGGVVGSGEEALLGLRGRGAGGAGRGGGEAGGGRRAGLGEGEGGGEEEEDGEEEGEEGHHFGGGVSWWFGW